MRRCVDCDADISDRGLSAYLCLTCYRERRRLRARLRPHAPERNRTAYHNAYYWRVRRAKLLSTRVLPCPTPMCRGTFKPWGPRRVCEDCRVAFREYYRTEYDRKRNKRNRELRRAA